MNPTTAMTSSQQHQHSAYGSSNANAGGGGNPTSAAQSTPSSPYRGGYYDSNVQHHHPYDSTAAHPSPYGTAAAAAAGGMSSGFPPMGNNQHHAVYPNNNNNNNNNNNMMMMPMMNPNPNNNNTTITNNNINSTKSALPASNLIRLTLRKPMGIVFEPMMDPHNPSQQRGVRICDLPRTGAAAMSQKLELGDELLSINDKTMSRLTFDEIMDFIIQADKDRVDLLFRRPAGTSSTTTATTITNDLAVGKNARGGGTAADKRVVTADGMITGPSETNNNTISPTALGGMGSYSNSVKWIDEKGGQHHGDRMGGGGGSGGKTHSKMEAVQEVGRRGRGEGKMRDDASIDDTYTDGYTIESQSQYTMETFDEDDRGRGREGKNSRQHGSGKGGNGRNRKSSSYNDPVESVGFLDMLIDTLCTSVMGRDVRYMCGDDSLHKKSKGGGGRGFRDKNNNYDDDDDEFTVDEDETYATYEENDRRRRNTRADDESYNTEEEGTFITNDDDGTRTLESKELIRNKKKQTQQLQKQQQSQYHHSSKDSHNLDKISKELQRATSSNAGKSSKSKDNVNNVVDQFRSHQLESSSSPSHHHRDLHKGNSAPDPPPATTSAMQLAGGANHRQTQQQQGIPMDVTTNEQESAIASGIALPLRELEYDDRVDYAADVSVMESLGGPSLLVERARHENAVNYGVDRALYENLDRQDPELAELVLQHGDGFVAGPGMTREETAFRDPYKFYEFAVCSLLKENEPEKVRLLSKLMAKYRGRERHLINKLSARYHKDGKHATAGGSGSGGGITGGGGGGTHTSATGVVTSSSGGDSRGKGNSLENKSSGMEKIHEGEDGEEEAGSSVLNDPSRANVAAIEIAKKKMKSNAEGMADTATGNSNDDGWPPAMTDAWGNTSQPSSSGRAAGSSGGDDRIGANGEESSRPTNDEEGSYSEGSSYTGDESGDDIDGTSPATIAQVSELLNYVYGKTSVAGQIDRVSTIMRAYEGREAVLLELLETKALIKANADSNRDPADMPMSLRNSPGLNSNSNSNNNNNNNKNNNSRLGGESSRKLIPPTPVSVLTAPSITGPSSPATMASPKEGAMSPSSGTVDTSSSSSKKKKKGLLGSFFRGKKSKGGGMSIDQQSVTTKTTASSGKNWKKSSKKGQSLNNEDDQSI